MLKSVLITLLVFLLGYRIQNQITTDEAEEYYDFIIVGAGTTGSAVAGRLSEDPNFKILVLEAGVSDATFPSLIIPYLDPVEGTEADWKYKTVPQKHAAQELVDKFDVLPAGKILGGTSSLNHMIYNRGSPHDYDSWEDEGAEGWGWEDVEPFFKKVERSNGPGMSERLGKHGAVNIERGFATKFTEIFENAAQEIGVSRTDYIDNMEGISRSSVARKKGNRQNSVQAYLRDHFPERKNRLHIVIEAMVTKVLFCHDEKYPRACGVNYNKNGEEKSVWARKEVIISAGAIGSPRLLMLSGIGPREHLMEKGIPVVVDLPGVGSNFQDHVRAVNLYYADKLPEGSVITAKEISEGFNEYIQNGTGALTLSAGVVDLIHTRTKLAGTPVSASTRKRPFPEIQLAFTADEKTVSALSTMSVTSTFKTQDFIAETTDAILNRNGVLSHFGVVIGLMHPKSKGTIRLNSSDPMDYPLVDPNYLANEDDVKIYIEGLRIAEKLQATSAFQKIGARIVFQPYCNTAENNKLPRSDEFYRCFLRSSAASEYHPCCSAKIGSDSDKFAVVDPELKVYGVSGLRVADASVMPHETSGNSHATCYMIGEKAADMIKKDWQ